MPLKIFTSYFYKIRFMDRSYLPVSTALWDPKWFHAGKGQSYSFKDKNGVWNGLRASEFRPGNNCDGLCRGPEKCKYKPDNCLFLKAYRMQLDNLNFEDVLNRMTKTAQKFQEMENLPDLPSIVLLFHETPTNPCSERVVLRQWFSDNGFNVEEF